MRMILKIKFPADSGSCAAKDGSMAKAVQTLKEQRTPGAAYFSMEDGMRCAYILYDAKNRLREDPRTADPGHGRARL